MYRQLPYLQAIAKNHLLVVIFFENTELRELTDKVTTTTQEIFDKTIAQKFAYEKKLIVNELNKFGIQTILTEPQHLTINTINKYLEIKARGLL
ncbi:cell divonision protein divonIC [Nonlabens tegetincola]|uniref:Cell divonision protein divonIC n=1 Tax=Nonlabens tegetincola TaxID=323273 RepID=A0A090Q2S9_9FLAO|nr:cell divonision protein divonIC [Nonlabens tegetincola]